MGVGDEIDRPTHIIIKADEEIFAILGFGKSCWNVHFADGNVEWKSQSVVALLYPLPLVIHDIRSIPGPTVDSTEVNLCSIYIFQDNDRAFR